MRGTREMVTIPSYLARIESAMLVSLPLQVIAHSNVRNHSQSERNCKTIKIPPGEGMPSRGAIGLRGVLGIPLRPTHERVVRILDLPLNGIVA